MKNKSEIAQSISIFALLFNNYNNIDNNNNNKNIDNNNNKDNNNKFKRFKIILTIVGFIIVFFSLFDFNTVLGYLMLIKFKWLIIINLIVIVGTILYKVISLILLKLFTNNDIKISTQFPKFIYNWLTDINETSKYEDELREFNFKILKREIIVYSLSFLFIFYAFKNIILL